MQGAKHNREFVSLAEAISWIAFRTHLDVAGIKKRIINDPASWAALNDAMRQFSVTASNGRLEARGRLVTDADNGDQAMDGLTDSMHENQFCDFQQFDLDRNRLQYLPDECCRVIVTWASPTMAGSPHDSSQSVAVIGQMGTSEASYERAFQSFAGVKKRNQPSHAAGYEDVEVARNGLLREFPASPVTSRKRGRPRKLDHDAVRDRAQILREQEPDISLTSAAACLAVEFGPNPETGKDWNNRGIERLIAPLWQSEGDK